MVGGVLGLAMARELIPVVTSIIVAGRVGSAFAAELGTMQVSEQTDSLRYGRVWGRGLGGCARPRPAPGKEGGSGNCGEGGRE